jgi:hypothetical protein
MGALLLSGSRARALWDVAVRAGSGRDVGASRDGAGDP